jgi:hypothetical protein
VRGWYPVGQSPVDPLRVQSGSEDEVGPLSTGEFCKLSRADQPAPRIPFAFSTVVVLDKDVVPWMRGKGRQVDVGLDELGGTGNSAAVDLDGYPPAGALCEGKPMTAENIKLASH